MYLTRTAGAIRRISLQPAESADFMWYLHVIMSYCAVYKFRAHSSKDQVIFYLENAT